MADNKVLHFKVLTPTKVVLETDAVDVVVPATEGSIGFLPNHTPFLSTLAFGEVLYTQATGGTKSLFVKDGFVEVGPDHVSLLADAAELPTSIDVQRAEASKKRAEQRLFGKAEEEDVDTERAQVALQRALARLEISRRA